MQFKFNLLSLVFFSSIAHATILVNQPAPYPQSVLGSTTGKVVAYAGTALNKPTLTAIVNTVRGYRVLDTAASTLPANKIRIDILSNAANTGGGTYVATLFSGAGQTSAIPISAASASAGATDPTTCSGCQGTNGVSVVYSPNQVLSLVFSLNDLCNAGATATGLCAGGAYAGMDALTTPTTLSQTVTVVFGVADATGTGLIGGTEKTDFTLSISNRPPVLGTCPATEREYYFPGDGQIYLKGGNFAASVNSGVVLQDLLFMAKPGAADAAPSGVSSNPIVAYPSYSTETPIKGFDNTQTYGGAVYAENSAGILSVACNTSGFSLQSRAIRGVLAESKCFIATAAFQDGRAAPVMMLRQFRDQILSHFQFGRRFIRTYYAYSPALAEWAWDKPIIRSIALRALAPVEFLAWAWLKISEAQEPTPSQGNQPYIDRLKQQIDEDDQNNGEDFKESNVGYSEEMKRKLGPAPTPAAPGDTYIDRVRKRLNEEESSADYAEKQKAALPIVPERESPIVTVKQKREPRLGYGEMKPIENAVSFKLGVNPGTEVSVVNGPHTYNEVYGSGWKPDFILHFEHQFGHSENFGSFGATLDFGVNYAGAPGLFDTPFAGSSVSVTNFSFIQIPFLLGFNYRFNLARILRPYVGASLGSIFYTEIRSDDQKDKRGYSFVYSTSVGLSVLLDFFDRATSRDSYLSTGIQHTYFFVEYMYLNTFQTNVNFKRAGAYAGFLFEF